jgi:hypothetical protein
MMMVGAFVCCNGWLGDTAVAEAKQPIDYPLRRAELTKFRCRTIGEG